MISGTHSLFSLLRARDTSRRGDTGPGGTTTCGRPEAFYDVGGKPRQRRGTQTAEVEVKNQKAHTIGTYDTVTQARRQL